MRGGMEKTLKPGLGVLDRGKPRKGGVRGGEGVADPAGGSPRPVKMRPAWSPGSSIREGGVADVWGPGMLRDLRRR